MWPSFTHPFCDLFETIKKFHENSTDAFQSTCEFFQAKVHAKKAFELVYLSMGVNEIHRDIVTNEMLMA